MAGRRKTTDTGTLPLDLDKEKLADAIGQLPIAEEKPGMMLGHNSAGADENTRQLLQSFIRRIETLDAELADLKSDRSEVLKEAKAEGFNLKIIGIIIRRRKRKLDERNEEEALVETYEAAIEGM